MEAVPQEFHLFSGIYLSPLLVDAVLGLLATIVTVRILNRFRLSRFLAAPSVDALALLVIYTSVISIFLIPA